MKLTNEFHPIRKWIREKGIAEHGNSTVQTVKLLEEAGELAKAILRNSTKDVHDAIGDIVIVLTSIADFQGTSIESAINRAYHEVKDRTGKMIDGDFKKDSNA